MYRRPQEQEQHQPDKTLSQSAGTSPAIDEIVPFAVLTLVTIDHIAVAQRDSIQLMYGVGRPSY